MATKPLSKWLSHKAGTKRIGATPEDGQSDGKRVNNFDKDGPPAIKDGFSESDPNAMGPNMRQCYDACAGAFTSPDRGGFNGADQHNDHYPAPLPRSERSSKYGGAADASTGGDDARPGVTGRWPGVRK